MKDHPIVLTLKQQIHTLVEEAQAADSYVRTGDIRQIARSINRDVKKLPVLHRLALAEHLYSNPDWRCALCATHILRVSVPDIEKSHLQYLTKFVRYFDDWSNVDDFGTSVLNQLLEKYPHETLEIIRDWNQSSNMWERRMSMVAFSRKIGESGQYTQECLTLAENLINDPEDLVKKAVGWALKDSMRGDKETVLNYVKDLRRRGVSSTITLYAIRDLKGKEREEILALKAAKKKKKKHPED